MRKLSYIMIMSLITINASAANNKQIAFSAVKQFLNLTQQTLVLEGHFIKTDPDYGSSCKIHIDFSNIGKEYLTITGEFTPAGSIGDGIYFNEDRSTFIQVELQNERLTLKQLVTDSFSTSTTTLVNLSKEKNTLRFALHQQSYFLFIPQIIEKTCLVENDAQK